MFSSRYAFSIAGYFAASLARKQPLSQVVPRVGWNEATRRVAALQIKNALGLERDTQRSSYI